MGFFNRLKKMVTGTDSQTDVEYMTSEIDRCMIGCRLKKSEYQLLSAFYYHNGITSYRSFYKYVFLKNTKKIKEVISDANKRAVEKCNIGWTIVRFYYNTREYIDIPFNFFSEKKDMRTHLLKQEIWHRANIKRLLITNPQIDDLTPESLKESLREIIIDILNEN